MGHLTQSQRRSYSEDAQTGMATSKGCELVLVTMPAETASLPMIQLVQDAFRASAVMPGER